MSTALAPRVVCLAVWFGLGVAPAGEAIKPGDLLKEADGAGLRFGYFPSASKLRLLVLRVPEAFTRWEARLSKPPADAPLCQWDGPPAPESFTLAVPRHDFRLVLIAPAEGQPPTPKP
ncbi:MAG: hypothetical protein FJ290_22705 [Planctomycetes bacterium]|nr:hypothetical protein [Planctomycetota bacterium]